jgi:hypothetical protein
MEYADWSSWLCIWLLWLFEHILEVIIFVISLSYFIDHGTTYLLVTSLPDEVRLAEYVCTHLFIIVFLAADPNFVPEEFE